MTKNRISAILKEQLFWNNCFEHFGKSFTFCVSTRRSFVLKQTYSFELQVCFITYDLLLDTRR